jgi:hypothetical protein
MAITPIETLTRNASSISIKSSGAFTYLEQAISSTVSSMTPRVALSDIPGTSETGWDVIDTVACMAHVAVHADITRRTAYLVINRAAAPLTGNYAVTLNATTYTYDATAGAPADVDALLQAVADLITAGSIATATVTSIDATTAAVSNAIKLTADPAAATAYGTFAINTGTAFPAGAALTVFAEFDTLDSVIVYGRPTPTVLGSVANSRPYGAMVGGWTVVHDITAELGADVPSGGYLKRLDLADIGYAVGVASGTLTDTLSGVVGYSAIMFLPSRES